MLPTRDLPQNKRHTQTESERLETNIPTKWTGKKTPGQRYSYQIIRFQKEDYKKRPRRSLHNTQGKNPSRRHKHCKYICAPYIGAPEYIRKILEDFKKDTDNSILTVGLNTPFSTMDRYSKQRISIVALNNMLYQIGLTNNIEPFTPKKQNICSFQMHMEHF